ncbi:MAG: non-canonical purine NTP pyrophosphatase [Euryarchaeota archaeon]|nr:non-canonical purine NTP pyrophosphatase [Euryarchaeota archaeon]|tara:strand:- start:57 stop:650 length:594 start_codon:yes stop_codon:yes gene_type:complete
MKILFATSNQNKIREAHALLSELGHSVEELRINGNLPDFIEPQSSDLKEVANSKLKQAISLIKDTELEDYAIMVEDSGLFIDEFPGFPGVFSSFVYDSIGLNGILTLLEKSTNRSAEYRTVTILQWKNKIWESSGVCKGTISVEKLGKEGFGYDPIFIPLQGNGSTFSQMNIKQKTLISHRTFSLKGLLDSLKLPSK